MDFHCLEALLGLPEFRVIAQVCGPQQLDLHLQRRDEHIVCRWTFERSRGGRPRKLGRAIGIDEYARRKGHRYNTVIVDLDKGQPIATFKGRGADEVMAWFTSRPQDERDRVEVVVLDMSKPFFAAVKAVFGDKVHVIDRFHVVQQAVSALDAVLRSVQKQLDQAEAKELKKLRKRWLKSADQLHVEELIARYEWRVGLAEVCGNI